MAQRVYQNNSTPQFVLERAKKEIAKAQTKYEQAKQRVPKEYHDFLMLLNQSIKMFGTNMAEKDDQARELGIWGNEKGTYVNVALPYVTVDGRVQLARDEHRREGKKLNILPAVVSDNGKSLSVTVESELLGAATGSVKINVGGKGVDQTNPLENAETSAIGRALSFLGYGLVGTGIASADEVESAKKAESKPRQSNRSDSSIDEGNVVDFKQKEPTHTQSHSNGGLKPNAQFIDMKAIETKSGNPCFEMIFKAGNKEEKCYAIGEMVDYVDQIAESLRKNVPCYIETELKENKHVLHELKVVRSA